MISIPWDPTDWQACLSQWQARVMRQARVWARSTISTLPLSARRSQPMFPDACQSFVQPVWQRWDPTWLSYWFLYCQGTICLMISPSYDMLRTDNPTCCLHRKLWVVYIAGKRETVTDCPLHKTFLTTGSTMYFPYRIMYLENTVVKPNN